jgi:ATP-dependent helicase IRC3
MNTDYELRYYQKDALKLLRYERKKNSRGAALIVLPTGSGKTLVFAEEAKKIAEAGIGNVLILAHRDELLEQAKNKLLAIYEDADVGIVGFGKAEWNHRIILGGVQTLSRSQDRLDQIRLFDPVLVIVDEAHHSIAPSYRYILNACPNAFKIGVTATWQRADGLDIRSIYGEPLYERTISEFIDEKHLCDLKCFRVRTYTQLSNIRTSGGDYNEGDLQAAINLPDRNARIAHSLTLEKYGGPKIPTVAFCSGVEHAFAQTQAFNDQGIKAACIVADTPTEERQEYFKQFSSWELPVLVSVGTLTEGWDANVWRIILAAPTQSEPLYIQRIGRGTRNAPGKKDCIILDFTDDCAVHQLDPITIEEVLGLPELLPHESVKEAIERQAREKKEREEKNDGDIISTTTDGELIYQEKQLRKTYEWKRLKNGGYLTDAGLSKIVLLPRGNGNFDVGVALKEGAGHEERVITHQNLSLSWAQSVAEYNAKKVEQGHGAFLNPNSHAYQVPATKKQTDKMDLLKIRYPENCTMGQASKLMDQRFAAYKARKENGKKKAS